MFRSYVRLLAFGLGLLIGVQVPGFIDDYAKRVSAHQAESEEGLKGFRETAHRFFQDDLDALVAHYRASQDEVMSSDAASVERLVKREEMLENEWLAMQGSWYRQIVHLLTSADATLLQETREAYTYQVLLSPDAIAWALGFALVVAWLIELVVLAVGWTLGFNRKHRLVKSEERPWR
ncbi:DUF2937 family protein [Pseudomonas sp. LRF_L74]|uniref:DUF2937 family protein n=1 Tax=Pseudomonas sp. LRF_L74 TaxID=3369422 RepID=UPI003F603375